MANSNTNIEIANAFSYLGKKANFKRDQYATKADLKADTADKIDEGHIAFCVEDGNYYKFLGDNTADPDTGLWHLWIVGTDDRAGLMSKAQLDKLNATQSAEETAKAIAAEAKAREDADKEINQRAFSEDFTDFNWTDGQHYVMNNVSLRGGIETLDGALYAETQRATTAETALGKRIDGIASAYQFVGTVADKDALLNYSVDHDIRTGDVVNVTAAIELNGQKFSEGSNFASLVTKAKGAATTEDNWDALGGTFNTDGLDNQLTALKKVVYTNHFITNISVTPNIGYKGENTDVTINYNAGVAAATDTKITFVVTENNKEVQLASGTKKALQDTTTYNVTASDSTTEAKSTANVTYNAYYPVYTFTSTEDTVDAIPEGAIKQPVTDTPVGKTYTYTIADNNAYLYIAMPVGMVITDATLSGYGVGLTQVTDKLAVENKGNYLVYRSNNLIVPGTYNLTFK